VEGLVATPMQICFQHCRSKKAGWHKKKNVSKALRKAVGEIDIPFNTLKRWCY
jgi:hypothetical protein